MVPGSTLERPRRLGDRDAARGLDRGLGGRQPHRRRAPDPHPPDPVPGDLAPAVRPRHLPDRLDRGVPGRHVQRLHLPARRVHPGLRPAAQLRRRRTRPARWAATSTSTPRSTCSRAPAREAPARRARPSRTTPAGRTPSRCSRARSRGIALRWAPQGVAGERTQRRARTCSRSIRRTAARATSSTATSSTTRTTSSCGLC